MQLNRLQAAKGGHLDRPVRNPHESVHRQIAQHRAILVELEQRMLPHFDPDTQVTWRRARLSVASIHAEQIAIAHTVRKAHRDLVPLGGGLSVAPTGSADLPRNAAAMTGIALGLFSEPTEPGALPNRARTMALRAMTAENTVPRPLAGRTILGDLASQHLGAAERGFVERQPDPAVDRPRWRALTKTGLANRVESAIEALHLDDCGSAAVAVGVPLRDQSAPCRLDLAFRRVGSQLQFVERAVDVKFHSLVLFKHCASADRGGDQPTAMLRRSKPRVYSLPKRVSGRAVPAAVVARAIDPANGKVPQDGDTVTSLKDL